jgi:hypothetical protein
LSFCFRKTVPDTEPTVQKNDGAWVGAQDMTATPEDQPGFAPDDETRLKSATHGAKDSRRVKN